MFRVPVTPAAPTVEGFMAPRLIAAMLAALNVQTLGTVAFTCTVVVPAAAAKPEAEARTAAATALRTLRLVFMRLLQKKCSDFTNSPELQDGFFLSPDRNVSKGN